MATATISSALEELEFKYTSLPEAEDIEPCIQFLSSSPPRGECLKRLRQIILSHNEIVELGDLQQVSETLKNATSIDLSHNYIQNWSIVGDLLTAIPYLKQLDLSFNPLDNKLDCSTIPSDNSLETLILNGVDLTFEIIGTLLNALPQLKVLQICCTSLDPLDKENINETQNFTFDQVKELYMDACQLNNWSDCLHIATKFPNLKKLRLSENGFDSIFESCEQTKLHIKDALCNLNTLFLNSSAIKDWKSIEVLGQLTALEHLRMREAPLFDEYDCETRHKLTIPRIPSLQTLNGSVINKHHRSDCERFFIRYYQDRDDKPTEIYEQLILIHGNLEPLICLDLTPQKHVRVKLRCDENNLNLVVRIKLNITIRALLNALSKASKIQPNMIRVLHTTPQYPNNVPTELRPSNLFLHTLHIEENDEFRIFSKNVPSDLSHL